MKSTKAKTGNHQYHVYTPTICKVVCVQLGKRYHFLCLPVYEKQCPSCEPNGALSSQMMTAKTCIFFIVSVMGKSRQML